mmetsp:Transcript_3087/g.7904  ORF Transcript_3087/g.7904 Transcript_3087/m.7904 type:complete len:254 (-) Transcript_3087:210-971(-)
MGPELTAWMPGTSAIFVTTFSNIVGDELTDECTDATSTSAGGVMVVCITTEPAESSTSTCSGCTPASDAIAPLAFAVNVSSMTGSAERSPKLMFSTFIVNFTFVTSTSTTSGSSAEVFGDNFGEVFGDVLLVEIARTKRPSKLAFPSKSVVVLRNSSICSRLFGDVGSAPFVEDKASAKRPSMDACANVSLAIFRSTSTSGSTPFLADKALAKLPSIDADVNACFAFHRNASTSGCSICVEDKASDNRPSMEA